MHKITPEMAGTWLDGSMGWHNTYRVIYIARNYGFNLNADDHAIVEAYAESDSMQGGVFTLPSGAFMAGDDVSEAARQISDEATDFLNMLAPEGYVFDWDAGELSLLPEGEQE